MSSRLTILDILQETDQVTDWFSLGVFLKMPSKVLKDIERRFSDEGLQRCKIELFSSWVERDLDASWEQIALALEKCNQNATADRIRKCHLPPSLPAITSQSLPPPQSRDDQPAPAAAVKTVVVEEEKVTEFRKIEKSYARLACSLKTSLDEKQVPLLKIRYFLEELLELNEGELSRATTIGDLFQLIKPHYCFLNTAILGDIIDEYIGEPLKHQLDEYKCQLKSFKESTSMSLLQKIGPQRSPSVGVPQVTIKLANCWLKVTIKRFERFVEQIFKERSTALAHIRVETGCICVTWLARRSAIPFLVAQAQEKTDFMELVGVLGLSISDIDILLEEEEEVDTFLSSALVRATRTYCVDAVNMLLYLGADPNTTTESDQLTPLMVACLGAGNIEIAKLLLQARANINQQSKTGSTALIVACNSETPNNDLVRLLIQSGADISINSSKLLWTALMYAAYRGHTSIVQYLLDEGAPVNTQDVDGVTSLMLASSLGHSEVVRVLINYGADVNILAKDLNATALLFACSSQRTVCVDLLLAGGADPNLCGRLSPLIAACITTGHDQPVDPTILDKLLSAGANPNTQTAEYGNTALIEAASYGYEKGVEILLNAAADVNIQGSDGDTALHHAAAHEGHLAVCKILLASGALASVTNSSGNTPLDLAQHNGHHKVCELLRSSMHSDPPATLPTTKEKPVEDRSQPHKTRRTILPSIKPRRSILPSIASISQYFKDLLLSDRSIKLRHSNQTQQEHTTADN